MQESKRNNPLSDNHDALEPESDEEDFGGTTPKPARGRRRIMSLAFGLIALAGLIIFVLHSGDLSAFASQVAKAQPLWLILAIGAQICTYLSQALVWWLVLRRLGQRKPLAELFILSIGKLFADQALPSAGLSGAFFIMLALTRRGTPREAAFTGFVFSSISFFAAFLLAVIAGFAIVAMYNGAPSLLGNGAIAYAIALLALLIVIAFVALNRMPQVRAWLVRRKAIIELKNFAGPALTRVGMEKSLFVRFVLLQLSTRVFDSITLWLAFRAIGESAPMPACFAGVSLASLAATVAPTPMGLGAFEAGLVATLSALGASMEAALTTTLLYRGLSLWAPLMFGFFIVQHEVLRARVKRDDAESGARRIEADPF